MSNEPTVERNVAPPTRDDLRSRIFSAHSIRKLEVQFFGATVELRQPTLNDIISAQTSEERQSAVIDTLVRYAYVPGTEQRIFEDTDVESLKALPFGADFIRISNALEELTEVNFLDKPGSSNGVKTST
jgi:hypothetical protein